MKKSVPFRNYLIKSLKDPEEAAGYLEAALEDGNEEVFLMALRDVAEARGGLSRISKKVKMNRAHLYKILSKRGNPEVRTLASLLKAFGLRLGVKSAA